MKNVLVLFALALASCSTLDGVQYLADASRPKPAPAQSESPPAAKSNQNSTGLDAAAKADWARYASPAPSKKSFGAGADLSSAKASQDVGIHAGEWAVYRTVENGQTTGVLKLAVISQKGDTWIYEFVSYTDKESTVLQEAVKGLDSVVRTGDSNQGQIVWVKVKDKDGNVQTIDGAMLTMAGAGYKSMLTANVGYFAGTVVAGGPVMVPAGAFSSSWKTTSSGSAGRNSDAGTAWVSTVVPLWHLIKVANPKGRVMELVDFGTSGYQSSLP